MSSGQPNGEARPDEGYKDRGPWVLRIVIGIAVIALGAFLLLRPAEDEDTGPQALPDFELPLLTGDGTFSSADLQGKPAVINFWASWCGPCRQETPLLQETYEKYKDEGLVILGVNVSDRHEDAVEFMDEFGVTYPVVVDEDKELHDQVVPVEGLPQTFFVDDAGNFLDQGETEGGSLILGAIDQEELEAQIQILLGDGE